VHKELVRTTVNAFFMSDGADQRVFAHSPSRIRLIPRTIAYPMRGPSAPTTSRARRDLCVCEGQVIPEGARLRDNRFHHPARVYQCSLLTSVPSGAP